MGGEGPSHASLRSLYGPITAGSYLPDFGVTEYSEQVSPQQCVNILPGAISVSENGKKGEGGRSPFFPHNTVPSRKGLLLIIKMTLPVTSV